jgi:hypothetical protein
MRYILKWNPELAKNLWTEFSPQRLIAMPAIIGLITLLLFTNFDDEVSAWKTIHYVSLSGFILLGMLWGVKSAADSILDEYNEKTWDWQKMSIIGPWRLAIGKLFGSTSYNWYGAMICWALFVTSSFYTEQPYTELKIAVLLILSMISVHGLMLIISLQMIRKADGRTKIKSNRIFIIGIVLISTASRFFGLSYLDDGSDSPLSWYNVIKNPTDIAILNTLFYGGWILAALYRSMRAELQFSDKPIWWFAFIFSNLMFQYGFIIGIEKFTLITGFSLSLGILFLETITLVYFLALTEAKDIVNFRYLVQSLRNNNMDGFLRQVPLWLITLPISFLLGLAAVLLFTVMPVTDSTKELYADFSIKNSLSLILALIAIYGFVIRDLGVLLLLNFSSRPKRADAAMIIYLLLAYVLFPMLTKDLPIIGLFYPNVQGNLFLMVAIPLVEMSIVLFFLNKRWQALKAPDNTAI